MNDERKATHYLAIAGGESLAEVIDTLREPHKDSPNLPVLILDDVAGGVVLLVTPEDDFLDLIGSQGDVLEIILAFSASDDLPDAAETEG